MDDKHRISIGEPSYPVAAVDRGKKVIVGRNQAFMVADHDFTRFSLVPSVDFFVDIPENVSESWPGDSSLERRFHGAFFSTSSC